MRIGRKLKNRGGKSDTGLGTVYETGTYSTKSYQKRIGFEKQRQSSAYSQY